MGEVSNPLLVSEVRMTNEWQKRVSINSEEQSQIG
jgi:hypothetical protein